MELADLKGEAKILKNLEGTFACYEKNKETKVVLHNPSADELKNFAAVIKE